ncbi:MAG TPA: ABC transporter substrate-binding protein [Burkholderiales bacterium]|nr:ABC transporter substrate-binding protein [Burkholderiales bacterium]
MRFGTKLKLVVGVFVAALPAVAAADVTIGVLAPLTGRIATYGAQFAGAVKMFEEQHGRLNDKERLKFVVYDTRGDATETISLTRKLVSGDNAVLIVGPLLSFEAEVAFPVAAQAKTPIISPSSAKPGVAAANRPYGFQFSSTSEKMSGQQVDKWLATAGKPIKTVVIIMDAKDAVSRADGTITYPQALKARGVQVLDTISIQTNDMDYSAPVTRAKNANPDGIVITMLSPEGGNLMREVRKQGLQQPVLGNVGILDIAFLKLAGPAAEGVLIASDYHESRNAEVVKWASEFQKKNNVVPQNVAALMYDTLTVVRSCVESQRISGKEADLSADRAKMQACLSGLKDFPAPITGTVSMNANGEGVRNTQILTVSGGKFANLR